MTRKLHRIGYLDNQDQALQDILETLIQKEFRESDTVYNRCHLVVQPSDFALTYTLHSQDYDAVIMNVGMNMRARLDTVETLRREKPRVPVIMYTGRDLHEVQQEVMARELNHVYCIQRPGEDTQELTDLLKKLLASGHVAA